MKDLRRNVPLFHILITLLWSVFWGVNAFGAPPPNVVMILSDDQAWGDYGFMGHPAIQTPNLDRLARESLTFRRGYVPSSLCCPSLASIITGQYPSRHRVVSNDPPVPLGMSQSEFRTSGLFERGRARMNEFMDAAPTIPKLLVNQGYLSLQTGKWWQGNYAHGGFTHGMTMGSRHGDKGLEIGRKTMEPIKDFIEDAPRSKQSQYDGGLRSPMMVPWKGTIAPRMDDNTLARSIDFAPTILKACGVPIPPQMQGVDLLNGAALQFRNKVHGECYTHDMVDFETPANSLRWRWVIEGFQKLILPHARNEPEAKVELYNLQNDPYEEHSLAAKNPLDVERLSKSMNARWNP